MPKEKTIPFEWKEWDELETAVNQYYNVKFYADFGPFAKDYESEYIVVNYLDGYLEEYDNEGNVKNKVNFHCVPN